MMQIGLSEAIDGIRVFLDPIIEGIRNENFYIAEWNHMERKWWSVYKDGQPLNEDKDGFNMAF